MSPDTYIYELGDPSRTPVPLSGGSSFHMKGSVDLTLISERWPFVSARSNWELSK